MRFVRAPPSFTIYRESPAIYSSQKRGSVRQSPDRHTGSVREFLDRHQREAHAAIEAGASGVARFSSCLLKRVADTRNLFLAFQYLRRYGGTAPGPDDICYTDLSIQDAWEFVRVLSRRILDKAYTPGPMRSMQVAKSSGGFREIWLANISDRIVRRGIVQVVQPILVPTFDKNSFCCSGRGCLRAIACAVSYIEGAGRYVATVDDIRDAFGSVPLRRLYDVLKFRLFSDDIVGLITNLTSTGSARGLRQGPPDSPLWMNLYLDHFVDRRWRKPSNPPPLLRYMDDFLILSTDREAAETDNARFKRIMREAGLPLKGSDRANELAHGEPADWLGFLISTKGNEAVIRLALDGPRGFVERLRAGLLAAHSEPDSPLRASQVIDGFVSYAGPCWPYINRQQVLGRVRDVARELAFEEAVDIRKLEDRWKLAYDRWRKLLDYCRSSDQQGNASTSASFAARTDHIGSHHAPHPDLPKVTLFTDGSCRKNPGRGGWAYRLRHGARRRDGRGRERCTTSNRMELTAVIRGLELLKRPCHVDLYTDSEYVALGINNRVPLWKANGWRRRKGKGWAPIKNQDLWQQLERLLGKHSFTCRHVPGHSGIVENERCHRLANKAIDEMSVCEGRERPLEGTGKLKSKQT